LFDRDLVNDHGAAYCESKYMQFGKAR